MSISIGFRIEFYAEGKLIGAAEIDDGVRVCAVPQPSDPIHVARFIAKADSWETGRWWPGAAIERVHHVEHYPILCSREGEPGVDVVIHAPAPGNTTAADLVRELRAAGYRFHAFADGSALARAVKAERAGGA